jgi:hypothetical protein
LEHAEALADQPHPGKESIDGHGYGSTPDPHRALLPEPAQDDVTPDARELHRVITASVRELLETTRLEAQAGAMDDAQIERLIFRAAASIVQSVSSLTEPQRGELLPNIVRVMLTAFLEEQAR